MPESLANIDVGVSSAGQTGLTRRQDIWPIRVSDLGLPPRQAAPMENALPSAVAGQCEHWPGLEPFRRRLARHDADRGLIPLYRWDGEGDRRLSVADRHLHAFVPRHPGQASDPDAFALLVAHFVMRPRYEFGEVIYLAPGRRPSLGQDLVAVTVSGNGYLSRFVGRDPDFLALEQLNPARAFHLPTSEIEIVHAVVGRG